MSSPLHRLAGYPIYLEQVLSMMHLPVCFYIALTLATSMSQASPLLSVKTNMGTIHGSLCTHTNSSTFQSIPYAQPPVGDLRFEPPQPYNSSYSNGSLNATVTAPSCIQFGEMFIENGPQSEDWFAAF